MAERDHDAERDVLLKLAARGLSIAEASRETGLSVEAMRAHWYAFEFRRDYRKLRRGRIGGVLPRWVKPIEDVLEADRLGLAELKSEAIARALRSLTELRRLVSRTSKLSDAGKVKIHLKLVKLALEYGAAREQHEHRHAHAFDSEALQRAAAAAREDDKLRGA